MTMVSAAVRLIPTPPARVVIIKMKLSESASEKRSIAACETKTDLSRDFPCKCEHNNPDSLDSRLFHSVVLAVAPAVAVDDASSLSIAA